MRTLKVWKNGAITIPVDVRRAWGLKKGSVASIYLKGNKVIAKKPSERKPKIADLFGAAKGASSFEREHGYRD